MAYFRVEWETYTDSGDRSYRHYQNAVADYKATIRNSDTLSAKLVKVSEANESVDRHYTKMRENRRSVRPLAASTYDPLANWS